MFSSIPIPRFPAGASRLPSWVMHGHAPDPRDGYEAYALTVKQPGAWFGHETFSCPRLVAIGTISSDAALFPAVLRYV